MKDLELRAERALGITDAIEKARRELGPKFWDEKTARTIVKHFIHPHGYDLEVYPLQGGSAPHNTN